MSRPIPNEKLRDYAKKVVTGLMFFALMRSPNPEKQKLLDRLKELRIEVQDIIGKLVPDWDEGGP